MIGNIKNSLKRSVFTRSSQKNTVKVHWNECLKYQIKENNNIRYKFQRGICVRFVLGKSVDCRMMLNAIML